VRAIDISHGGEIGRYDQSGDQGLLSNDHFTLDGALIS